MALVDIRILDAKGTELFYMILPIATDVDGNVQESGAESGLMIYGENFQPFKVVAKVIPDAE